MTSFDAPHGGPVLLRRDLLASRPRPIPEEPTSPPPPPQPFEADVPTAYVAIDPLMLEKARSSSPELPDMRASSPELTRASSPGHEPAARVSQPAPVSADSIEAAILASSATVPEAVFAPLPARGLANRFTRLFDRVAPLGYPEVNQLTQPIRDAAVDVDDPDGTALWAGTAYREACAGPVADIVANLNPDTGPF